MTTLPREPRHVAYRVARHHIAGMALSAPDVPRMKVAGCPQWTVKGLVGHVAGHALDRIGETVGDDESLDGVLERWERVSSSTVEPMIARGPEGYELLLMDTFTHEVDLHATLGTVPQSDHPGYPWALDVLLGGLSWSLDSRGLPAVRLSDGTVSWVAGSGEPAVAVQASRYELYRTLSGRRTPEQVAELDWSEDPGRWLPAFYWGPFSEPSLPGA
jgi:hypothetical protein